MYQMYLRIISLPWYTNWLTNVLKLSLFYFKKAWQLGLIIDVKYLLVTLHVETRVETAVERNIKYPQRGHTDLESKSLDQSFVVVLYGVLLDLATATNEKSLIILQRIYASVHISISDKQAPTGKQKAKPTAYAIIGCSWVYIRVRGCANK